MAITITINSVDRTRFVKQQGLSINNIITRQIDRLQFNITKTLNGTILNYKPTIGHEVIIENNSVKIFGGIITRTSQSLDSYGILNFTLECEDFTRFLDHRLAVQTYSNMTVNDIIADLNTEYLTGFTLNNVDATKVIDHIAFNYIPVSKALQKLADLINFDWFVDYDKDIHFKAKDSTPAPFEINDSNASYITNSLKIIKDNSQVKNVIFVRGGQFIGSTLTSEIVADGSQTIFPIGYEFSTGISATLSANPLSIGVENLVDPNDYDVVWNFQEKVFKFKELDKPSVGAVLKIVGSPYYPVRLKVRDVNSIASFSSAEGSTGEYEYLIIDTTIKTREGARERATAELESYKDTLSEGSFQTYTDGLKAGQVIRINSTAHDIDEEFVINRVTTKMWTSKEMMYTVNLVTTKTFGIIELLQKLLLQETNNININPDEVIDIVESYSESITISETFTAELEHNLQRETITMNETFTAQSLDYNVEFVLGEFAPTDVRRIFILDGSILG